MAQSGNPTPKGIGEPGNGALSKGTTPFHNPGTNQPRNGLAKPGASANHMHMAQVDDPISKGIGNPGEGRPLKKETSFQKPGKHHPSNGVTTPGFRPTHRNMIRATENPTPKGIGKSGRGQP
jgi:hypothetical protein